MLDSSGPNLVETHRILVCPYCGRLQRVIMSPAPFGIECMRCHRVFLVSHDGAVAIPVAARVDVRDREPSNTLSRMPGQVFIDPQVGPAEEVDEPAPSRSRANPSRGVLPWLRSVVITLVILGAVVGVARIVVVMAESVYNAIRQAVEEGSMTTFDRSEIESLRELEPGTGAPQGVAPPGSVIHNQEQGSTRSRIAGFPTLAFPRGEVSETMATSEADLPSAQVPPCSGACSGAPHRVSWRLFGNWSSRS